MNASDEDSSAAKHLSALGASKGGQARAAKLGAKERSRIAKKAAQARWGKADDQEEHQPETIRAKWLFDGATTLAEAAAMLRAEAERLDQMHKEGWTLEEPIADDYGFLIPPPAGA